jgi:nucleoside-diphosphate-sugar epimerase
MKFLIAGGAGSVGQDVAASLLAKGHGVRVLDKRAESFPRPRDRALELMQGALEDAAFVRDALRGVDTVIDLAWSFSDDPIVLMESDLKGHAVLLEACVASGISRLLYASTAVVYGKPVQVPITEAAPSLVEDARKPFYAVAKLAAEKLALAYGKAKGLPVTIVRFWWSFGAKIGGRHLRDMITSARNGCPLTVPAGAGGSFLDHEDLAHALLLAAQQPAAIGQMFNLATIYLEWRDIAQMIIAATGSPSRVDAVPAAEWRGAPFLADSWELSTAKAEQLLAYRSLFSPAVAGHRLEEAIRQYHLDLASA